MTETENRNQTARRGAPNELDLVGTALVIQRHRWLALVVFLVVCTVGAAYVWFVKPVYRYSTTLRVGWIANGDRNVLLQTPDELATQLEYAYVPAARERLADSSGNVPNLSIRTPKGGGLVILTSDGPPDALPVHQKLHQLATDPILEMHDKLFEERMSSLHIELQQEEAQLKELSDPSILAAKLGEVKADLAQAKSSLARVTDDAYRKIERDDLQTDSATKVAVLDSLKGSQELLAKQLESTKKQTELYQSELADLQKYLAEAGDERKAVLDRGIDQGSAEILLLLDTDIQRYRSSLADIRDSLTSELPVTETRLEKQLEDNARQQAVQQVRVDQAKLRLKNLDNDLQLRVQEQRSKVDDLQSQVDSLTTQHEGLIAAQKLTVSQKQLEVERSRKTTRLVDPSTSRQLLGVSLWAKIIMVLIAATFFALFAVITARLAELTRRRAAAAR